MFQEPGSVPFGDITNRTTTAPSITGSALKQPQKATAGDTNGLVSATADPKTNGSDIGICGLDHNDLSCSFKFEDGPGSFKGNYKYNVNCTDKDCGKPVKPKAWHCHGFDTCQCILCDLCYSVKLVELEKKKADDAGETVSTRSSRRARTATAVVGV